MCVCVSCRYLEDSRHTHTYITLFHSFFTCVRNPCCLFHAFFHAVSFVFYLCVCVVVVVVTMIHSCCCRLAAYIHTYIYTTKTACLCICICICCSLPYQKRSQKGEKNIEKQRNTNGQEAEEAEIERRPEENNKKKALENFVSEKLWTEKAFVFRFCILYLCICIYRCCVCCVQISVAYILIEQPPHLFFIFFFFFSYYCFVSFCFLFSFLFSFFLAVSFMMDVQMVFGRIAAPFASFSVDRVSFLVVVIANTRPLSPVFSPSAPWAHVLLDSCFLFIIFYYFFAALFYLFFFYYIWGMAKLPLLFYFFEPNCSLLRYLPVSTKTKRHRSLFPFLIRYAS